MDMEKTKSWDKEAEVVIVGYGGAGAISAIAAHDAGAKKVLILEKQQPDTPTKVKHTPSTRMCGGGIYWPTDVENAVKYMKGMAKIANETVDEQRMQMFNVLAEHLVSNIDWMKSIGIPVGGEESISPTVRNQPHIRRVGGRVFEADFHEVDGWQGCSAVWTEKVGPYRNGAALFKHLTGAVEKRNIPVMWETPGLRLITENGEVRGVVASHNGKEIKIRASRAVILTCGGFEFNQWMMENHLRVNPVHFYGNPGNTGDGITMAVGAGAALHHMNNASWRVTLKFPDHHVC
jgi:succinate dehydrogenase/fumarate reductase flavoprotein subunit